MNSHPDRLIGIGEVLWDLLPGGRQLGGAPANFAYHARALGADGRIISRVGRDANGGEIIARLEQLGVPTDCIEIDPTAPTGTVSVELSSDGQPHYKIHQDVAWDRIAGEENGCRAVQDADAVCFGSLAQRSELSRNNIRKLLSLTKPGCLRVLDVNLRQHFYSRAIIEQSLQLATVLKVNDEELPRLAEMFSLTGDARTQIAELSKRFELRTVACTRGERGSILLHDGEWSDHPGIATTVADTIGAGDSFTAAMTLGLLAGWGLDRINEEANRVAAYVASRPGGTPILPEKIRARFHSTTTLETKQ
jgi:fructokinase